MRATPHVAPLLISLATDRPDLSDEASAMMLSAASCATTKRVLHVLRKEKRDKWIRNKKTAGVLHKMCPLTKAQLTLGTSCGHEVPSHVRVPKRSEHTNSLATPTSHQTLCYCLKITKGSVANKERRLTCRGNIKRSSQTSAHTNSGDCSEATRCTCRGHPTNTFAVDNKMIDTSFINDISRDGQGISLHRLWRRSELPKGSAEDAQDSPQRPRST
mmetsp:Transcript_10999/g.22442  ORF Transcript_10999/g.22442 Transcript_10999/m.22442 type:complete len:216 (-) Transcript_10999:989-1636(-)